MQAKAEQKLRALGVSMLVLFGSAATKAKKREDIDVAVFLTDAMRPKTLSNFAPQSDITEAIADFLGEPYDTLDTVFIGPHTAPLLAFHIARDGKLLFGSEQDFMRFRLRAIKVYQDTGKLREANREHLTNIYA